MERRIRVLHLIDNLGLGGAQPVLFNCLTYADPKYEIVLASLDGNRKALFGERVRGLGFSVVALSPYRWLPVYLVTLPLLLWRNRFDVVQCHLLASNWLGKPLAKLFRVPLVISHDHSHEFRFAWPMVLELDRWANGFADRIFLISQSFWERLRMAERVPGRKLIYLRNGVGTGPRHSRKTANQPKIAGPAGRLVDWKTFDRFLLFSHELA